MVIRRTQTGQRRFGGETGFTLAELTIAMVMSGMVLSGIFIIVSGSHSYILKARDNINLQQDYSLIDQVLARKVRESLYGKEEIYASYSDYTGSGLPQSSGTCLKLYFPSGDSTVFYKENSDFKIQASDLSTTNLIQGVVDSILFTEGIRAIATTLNLQQAGKTISANWVHAFRNIEDSETTVDTLRPVGTGTFTQILVSDCSSNWECVDEAVSDEGVTRVRERDGVWRTDTYATSNSSSTNSIDSVVVYVRARKDDDDAKGTTALYTNSTTYYGSNVDLEGVSNYINASTTYTTNPNTSSAWTTSEIDAIQIGVQLYEARCTQVWAIVYYSN